MNSHEIFNKRAPLYEALSKMTPRSHWPDRSRPWEAKDSEVLAFIVEHWDCTLPEASRLLTCARAAGFVAFDRKAKLWCGTGKEPVYRMTAAAWELVRRQATQTRGPQNPSRAD